MNRSRSIGQSKEQITIVERTDYEYIYFSMKKQVITAPLKHIATVFRYSAEDRQ